MNIDWRISEKSAATRLIYWKAILNVLKNNPLTGTGFGGIYLFYREIGSAHSEYMDILLRTGLIGFAFYLFLWYKLLTFYKKIDLAIYSACWGIFIFGLFQETTKLPYMAFVFFTLFNFTLLPMQNNDFIQHN